MAGKRETSSKRLQQSGKKPIMVWFDKDEHALIKRFSKLDERPMTSYVRRATMKQVREDQLREGGE
jgi:hypothetical protein